MEKLQAHDITVILNVAPEILDFVANITGAIVLPQVEHVDKFQSRRVVGHCTRFHVTMLGEGDNARPYVMIEGPKFPEKGVTV